MKRRVVKTADGSTTIHLEGWNENYHSSHGAIQEAYHVFIDKGLDCFQEKKKLSILEIGFGTGLNAFITFLEAKKSGQELAYTGVEAYPVSNEEIALLNYVEELNAQDNIEIFKEMHISEWGQPIALSPFFQLEKRKQFFSEIDDVEKFDLIYFDAFGARVQPELWTEAIFQRMYNAMKSGGILVTYAAKGSVRRAMQEVGFMVEKLPGPPGKREMLRASRD
ncbi:hypothetical protein NBRC110019_29010 [Neptunitalea chrysea]|uniref:MnmC-like methyltransferase domain-containing protein n=1 Tax=Neptunitalea chrysea TaxID=1647581 RepID=A0A9W6B794_9FLAO|nr:tRNA (5-methylaminomethyl-2-thiouridine)(34)-methyltransferase MnmD [Neptunitalea chrysea]GLB53860.1 hypothetical protein NBRC110019_29010 [Neptunitalea chrysea]